jgi:hypothetical protein
MIKKILILIVILVVIILLVIGYYNPSFFFGDSFKTKGKKDALGNQNDSSHVSALMSSLDFYSSSNIISLLSIKYSLEPEILIEILSTYNSQTQLDYDFDNLDLSEIKNKMEKDIDKLNENLTNIANKHNIQPTTLVNILIDYKLLKNTNK